MLGCWNYHFMIFGLSQAWELLFHLKKFPHNLNIVVFECYYVLVGRSKVHDSYLCMVKNVENEPLSERGNIYRFLLLFQAKVEKCIQKHNDLKERLRQTNEEVKLLRPQFDAAKETLKEAKAVLRNRQNEFRKKESELRKLAKERDDISARIQELQKRSVVVFMWTCWWWHFRYHILACPLYKQTLQ